MAPGEGLLGKGGTSENGSYVKRRAPPPPWAAPDPVCAGYALRAANVPFEFHRYRAKDAFANETLVGDRKLPVAEYNAAAAELAWRRTMAFFRRHLG
jgi:dienelactone hydrolase